MVSGALQNRQIDLAYAPSNAAIPVEYQLHPYNMTTYLDIVDTVVKIGLGALISGVTTYFVTTKSHVHDNKKSLLEHKRNVLTVIASQIDEAGTIKNQVGFQLVNADSSFGIDAGVISEWLKELDNACDVIKNALTNCYLIGDVDLAGLIMAYFNSFSDFQSALRSGDTSALDSYHQHNKEAVSLKLRILGQYKTSLERIFA